MLHSCAVCLWAYSTVSIQLAKPVRVTAATCCTSLAVLLPMTVPHLPYMAMKHCSAELCTGAAPDCAVRRVGGHCGRKTPNGHQRPLWLIAKVDYLAMVVVGYSIAEVFSPQTGRFLRIKWLR